MRGSALRPEAKRRLLALSVAAVSAALVLTYIFHIGAVEDVVIPCILALPPLYLSYLSWKGEAKPVSLAQVADQLADAVQEQWELELEQWQLKDSGLLPVSWRAADPDLVEGWGDLRSTATGWPGGPPEPLAHWADSPVGLAGSGNQLAGVLSRVPTGRLVVLGEPGSGKTVLLVRLLLDLIEERRRYGGPVPVLVSLASWKSTGQDLRTWLAARLSIDYHLPSQPAPAGRGAVSCARALMDRRLLLFILDGLDEIAGPARGSALKAINDALRSGQGVVLSSRVEEYRAAVNPATGPSVRLEAAAGITLQQLDPSAVGKYLRRSAAGTAGRWDPVVARLGTGAAVAQALTTPLMASLARAVYNPQPGEHQGPLPNPADLCDAGGFPTRVAVEQHLLDGLIPAVYPSPKDSSPSCPWTSAKAERWLVFLASHLDWRDTTDLAWWQLHHAAPRSLVRYPVALVTALTAGLLTWLGAGLTQGIWASVAVKAEVGPVLATMIGLIAGLLAAIYWGLLVGLAVWLVARFFSDEPAEIRETPARGLRWTASALVRGLVILPALFVALALVDGLIYGFGGESVSFFVSLFVVAAVFGVAFQPTGVPSDPATAASPQTTLTQDRRTFWKFPRRVSLVIALGLGLGGLAAALVHVTIGFDLFITVLALGLGLGLWRGLVIGYRQTAWGAFTVTRCWLAARRRAPLRLMKFLEDAHQRRGVLRQVGGVYQFRHADLQHRLANRPSGVCPAPAIVRPGTTSPPGQATGPALVPEDDQGVEFRESMRRKAGAIAGAIGLVLFASILTAIAFSSGHVDVLYGIFALVSWLWVLAKLAEIVFRPKLTIDGKGITIRYFEDDMPPLTQTHLPWAELSAVEIRPRHPGRVLVCVPQPGSALPAGEQAKKLWSDHVRGFVVIDVTTLGGSPPAVCAALTRYSGGRYQPGPHAG